MRSTIPEGQPLVLQLAFPAEWRQSRNPLAEPAAAWARTFLAESGVLADPAAAATVETLDLAGYSGFAFYAADRGLLCTVTAFLALLELEGDRLAATGGGAAEADESILLVAWRGDGTRPPDPLHAAYWELAQRYHKKVGRAFLSRHAERCRAFRRCRAAAGQDAAAASLPLYLERRREGSLALLLLDFLELDASEALPEELVTDPRLPSLERLAADITTLQQELVEAASGGSNAARLLAADELASPLEAFRQLVELHNRKVAELDRVGRAMARDYRSTPFASFWIRVGGLLAGLGRWHADNLRRRGDSATLGGRLCRLSLDEVDEPDLDESSVLTGAWRLPFLLSLGGAALVS